VWREWPGTADQPLSLLSRSRRTGARRARTGHGDAEETFVAKLRRRWADDELHDACLDFLEAHYAFWKRNARLLTCATALADASDMRVLYYRKRRTRGR
jgi:hypothetical protein